jgi:hypothetical protein
MNAHARMTANHALFVTLDRSKNVSERLLASGRKMQSPGVRQTLGPAQFDKTIEQGSSDSASQVVTPLAPVDASTAQRSPRARHGVDPDAAQQRPSGIVQDQSFSGMHESLASHEAVIDEDAKLAGHVVVTDARFAQRGIAWPELPGFGQLRQAHHSLQHLANVGAR